MAENRWFENFEPEHTMVFDIKPGDNFLLFSIIFNVQGEDGIFPVEVPIVAREKDAPKLQAILNYNKRTYVVNPLSPEEVLDYAQD